MSFEPLSYKLSLPGPTKKIKIRLSCHITGTRNNAVIEEERFEARIVRASDGNNGMQPTIMPADKTILLDATQYLEKQDTCSVLKIEHKVNEGAHKRAMDHNLGPITVHKLAPPLTGTIVEGGNHYGADITFKVSVHIWLIAIYL